MLGVLSANGQTLAVTKPAVAADLDQALDVHGSFAAKIAFHFHVVIDIVTQLTNFGFSKILDTGVGIDAGRFDDVVGDITADAVDIRQGDLDSLLTGQIDTCDTCHLSKAPPLCCAGFPAALLIPNAVGAAGGRRSV